jgi:hypothetical protein
LLVGGVLAWMLGGPAGFIAACLVVLLIRIWRLKRQRRD